MGTPAGAHGIMTTQRPPPISAADGPGSLPEEIADDREQRRREHRVEPEPLGVTDHVAEEHPDKGSRPPSEMHGGSDDPERADHLSRVDLLDRQGHVRVERLQPGDRAVALRPTRMRPPRLTASSPNREATTHPAIRAARIEPPASRTARYANSVVAELIEQGCDDGLRFGADPLQHQHVDGHPEREEGERQPSQFAPPWTANRLDLSHQPIMPDPTRTPRCRGVRYLDVGARPPQADQAMTIARAPARRRLANSSSRAGSPVSSQMQMPSCR